MPSRGWIARFTGAGSDIPSDPIARFNLTRKPEAALGQFVPRAVFLFLPSSSFPVRDHFFLHMGSVCRSGKIMSAKQQSKNKSSDEDSSHRQNSVPAANADGAQPKGKTAPISPSAGPSTLAVHAGEDRQKICHSITDPIFVASTYTFADTQSVIDYIEQKQPREEYGRYGNPSERVLERKLAALEGGEAALLFSSGMSAWSCCCCRS